MSDIKKIVDKIMLDKNPEFQLIGLIPIEEILQYIKNNHYLNWISMLETATYHRRIKIIKWIFDNQKELNIAINLENIFDQINKYGVDMCEEQFTILLDNDYTNYQKVLNKTYIKFPKIVDRIIDFISPKSDEDLKDNIIKEHFKFENNVESMYEYLSATLKSGNINLSAFHTQTLINIYDNWTEDDDEENEIYQTYKHKRPFLELRIYDFINVELNCGNYKSKDYPIMMLSQCLIMKNNWKFLCPEDRKRFGISYNVDPTFEKVFEAQGKIIEKINDNEYYDDDFCCRGVNMLEYLYPKT